jgi:hypothetical protein
MDECGHVLYLVQFEKGRKDTRRGRNASDAKAEGTDMDSFFDQKSWLRRHPRPMERLPLLQS